MRTLGIVRLTFSLLICFALLPCRLESQASDLLSKASLAKTNGKQVEPVADHHPFSLGDLPLQFEENVGQAGHHARFLARGHGYTMLFNPDSVILNLSHGRNQATRSVAMRLLDSQPAPKIAGQEQTPTRTNYYIGKDPSVWHLNVRSFRSVAYADIYKGIDLVYHGNGNQLEYDFVVSPGADPAQVRMRFDGLKPVMKGDDLSFEGENQISVRALKAFQFIKGEKKSVDAVWEIRGDQVSIHLGEYDPKQELIIDPIFFYGAYIGGSSTDAAISIIPAEQQGYYYVALSTSSMNIEEPQSLTNPSNPNCSGNSCGKDTLILELQATTPDIPAWTTPVPNQTSVPVTEPAIMSATYLGGNTGATAPTAMIGDSKFNLYVTGTTTNASGLPEMGTQICLKSCPGFVAKLDSSLTLVYSLGFPGIGNGITADTDGDAYLTGSAAAGSLTIPPSDAAFQGRVTGGSALVQGTHAYLTELGPSGTLLFSTYIGGSGFDQGNAITLSGSMVYIAGQTSSTDFPMSADAYQKTYHGAGSGGQGDAFVVAVKNLPTDPALIYSTYLGGSGDDIASSIAADSDGNAVIAGSTTSSDPENPFPIQSEAVFEFANQYLDTTPTGFTPTGLTPTVMLPITVSAGSQDAFVTGLSTNGALRFTDFLGGDTSTNSTTSAHAVVLDQVGVIYVTGTSDALMQGGGFSSSTSFLTGTVTSKGIATSKSSVTTDIWAQDGQSQYSGTANNNVFFVQIDPSGQDLLQATIAGGNGNDQGNGLSVSGYCFPSQPKVHPEDYPPCIGTASIVGITGEAGGDASTVTELFDPAATSFLYPVSPTPPQKEAPSDTSGTSGFFAQEELAGFCNMQLQQQIGPSLTFQGLCVSGTSNGTVSIIDNTGAVVQTANVTINNASTSSPSGSLTLNFGTITGVQPFKLVFSFLPLGAIGAVGTCGFDGNGVPSGCPIATGGGGAGTIFNITAGALTVSLTCTPANNCVPVNTNTPTSYYVQTGVPVTLNAAVTNASPATVNWSNISTAQGTLTQATPSTSAIFTPGATGGQTTITATSVADGKTQAKIILNTLETPTISLTVTNSSPIVYGQTAVVSVLASGHSSTPTGPFTYLIDGRTTLSGTLSAGGTATINLIGLSAGSHSLVVTYPGNDQNGSFLTGAAQTTTIVLSPAMLTVQATNASVSYGQPIPPLAYTITGFQYGESISTIGGAPLETTTASKGSQVGPYAITITRGTLGEAESTPPNYTYTFVNGTLTITSLGSAPPPLIAPVTGVYTAPQNVTITDTLQGVNIYYTTNGAAPTVNSTHYSGPFTVSASANVQAIAVADGYSASGVTGANFTIGPPTLSSLSLSFGNIVQGFSSAAQTVTFTNQGKNALGGLTFAISGSNSTDFALTSGTTCGTSIAAGASCSVAVVFSPTATGVRSATLAFTYAGTGSPQSVSLGGTGLSPLAITSDVSQLVAGTTFQFSASGPAIWSASAGTISSSGLFTAPNPPPNPATVTITATSATNAQVVATTQVTIVPAPVVVVPPTTTLTAGQTVSIPLTISSGTGIPGELLALTCVPATLPTNVTCAFTPNPVKNASGGSSVTLKLSSNALTSELPKHGLPWNTIPFDGSIVLVAGCIMFSNRRSIRGRKLALLIGMFASAALLTLTACGTGGSFKSTPQQGYVTGAYTIDISITGATPGAPDFNQTLSIFSVKVTIQ